MRDHRAATCTGGVAGLIAAVALTGNATRALGQGCVASPNNPACMMMAGHHGDDAGSSHPLGVSISYRGFQSARHFGGRAQSGVWLDGDVENTDREKNHQQMINSVSLIDITLNYAITPRWSATLDLPYIDAKRSSLFEHTDGSRHFMSASGIGDVRLLTDYWLLKPETHMNGNISIGVGVKFPTGDDHATGTSYRFTGPVERPVDQSIQPGDGGYGIILQLQAYQKVYRHLSAYAQGYYLISPKEQNQTQRVMGDFGVPNAMTYNSISDQYYGRGGFSYAIWPSQGLKLLCGARIEGVPVFDAVGGSLGYRQPGYTISVEPGLTWDGQRNSLSILAPVAVYRNRERSAAEIAMGRPGGDASFADFSILATFTHRF